ncbi:MAG: hypothetical protein DI539_20400 [Flavobacterium psychrophilum]|nr:MAG: hypothetical protein DI539_20400 [Flavobacterium psychrophilum]
MKKNDFKNEKWVNILTLEHNYQISNYGRVKSIYKNGQSLILTPQSNGQSEKDYLFVTIEGKKHYIHHLVLFYFLGTRPHEHDCDHIDGNRHNNRLDNLRYLHRSLNRSHKGEKHGGSKLTNKLVKMIRYMVSQGVSQKQVADMLEVSGNCISSVITGRTWSHVA